MPEWIDAAFSASDSDERIPQSTIRDRMYEIMLAAGEKGVHWTEFRRKIGEWQNGDPDAARVKKALGNLVKFKAHRLQYQGQWAAPDRWRLAP